jgi:hypothetical protein
MLMIIIEVMAIRFPFSELRTPNSISTTRSLLIDRVVLEVDNDRLY